MVEVTFGVKYDSKSEVEAAILCKKFARFLEEDVVDGAIANPLLVDTSDNHRSMKKGAKNYVEMVWGGITKKAQSALAFIAKHKDGCTKEEIAEGAGLSGTRDLGGALSSVSRRCQTLRFNLNVIYEKVMTAHGERYVMADDAAEMVLALVQE